MPSLAAILAPSCPAAPDRRRSAAPAAVASRPLVKLRTAARWVRCVADRLAAIRSVNAIIPCPPLCAATAGGRWAVGDVRFLSPAAARGDRVGADVRQPDDRCRSTPVRPRLVRTRWGRRRDPDNTEPAGQRLPAATSLPPQKAGGLDGSLKRGRTTGRKLVAARRGLRAPAERSRS